MTDTDVLIVGAGPAGLMLAAELHLAGVDTTLVEAHTTRPGFSRGYTLNSRSLDLLSRRGLADRFLAEGHRAPHAPFASLPVALDLAGAATDHPFTLALAQSRAEELLEEHLTGSGATVLRGHRAQALDQDTDSVTAQLDTPHGPRALRATYLVGCDGSRSTVRKQAGIAFPGTAAESHTLMGDVVLDDEEELAFGVCQGPGGQLFAVPREDHVRIAVQDPDPPRDKDTPVTGAHFADVVARVLGRPVRIRRSLWLTRFGDAARQADTYRSGRVLLAGDAAHIHPPSGATGVNVALDDAVNLGWKLAATVRGRAPRELLDSYHAERHPAGTQVLTTTRALALLGADDPGLEPLTRLLTRVFSHHEAGRVLAEAVTALDTCYDVQAKAPGAHPWVGRMVPDLELEGQIRLSRLLAPGLAVLVEFAGPPVDTTGYEVTAVEARAIPDPEVDAVLVRPRRTRRLGAHPPRRGVRAGGRCARAVVCAPLSGGVTGSRRRGHVPTGRRFAPGVPSPARRSRRPGPAAGPPRTPPPGKGRRPRCPRSR